MNPTLKMVLVAAGVTIALMAIKSRVYVPLIDPGPAPPTQTTGQS